MNSESDVTRTSAPHISVNARQVEIMATHLADHYKSVAQVPAEWNDPLFWNVDASPDERCQFLAVGNAINFRFWTIHEGSVIPSTGILEGESYRGSMYMWRRLRIATSSGKLSLEAADLANLTIGKLRDAFLDDEGHNPIEAGIEERLLNLQDLGAKLMHGWKGRFINVVDASNGSLDAFVKICSSFRAFDDPVQKLTMVNAIMLSGSHLADFDSEPLPAVDYHLVKQVLRQGMVSVPADIRAKLTSNALLEPVESLALRDAVLKATIAVADSAGLSTAFIDNIYWLNRRICGETAWHCSECPFEAACPKLTEFGIPLESTRYY